MTLNVAAASLDWALAHIQAAGDTDIFPVPFEFDAIASEWATVRAELLKVDLDGFVARPHRECLTPKGRYAYRTSTQLDPFDSLLFAALLYEIGSALEQYRVPSARNVVFSFRFAPTAAGQLYDPSVGWAGFIEESRKRAEQKTTKYVAVADISDFYYRLYHHPVENTLDAATNNSAQGKAIVRLLSQWRGRASFGIPVGPSPSRLIAEATIDDVDKLLLARRANFCRFSDDYRIFCRSKSEAYAQLTTLAEALQQNHGLTLQPGKTRIMPADEFLKTALRSAESEELNNLEEKYDDIVDQLGLQNRYEKIEYDDLSDEDKALVDSLNLADLLEAEMAKDEIDIGVTRFVLTRLGQLDNHSLLDKLTTNAEKLYPVLASLMEYVGSLTRIPPKTKLRIGKRLMRLTTGPTVGHLPYHRAWFLSVFARRNGWGQDDELVALYDRYADGFTRRKAILAMARAHQSFWFRSRLDAHAMQFELWERRAFLAGTSCLGKDEKKFWYQSQRRKFDPLDACVVKWATANPL